MSFKKTCKKNIKTSCLLVIGLCVSVQDYILFLISSNTTYIMSAKTNATVQGGVDRGDTYEKAVPSSLKPYEKPPLSSLINCDDFEEVARNTLAKKTWAFYSSAATDCYTYERNRSFFSRIWFRPRILRDVRKIDTQTTILGHKVGVPFMVHPAALVKLVHPDGEKGIAKGLSKENVPYCVSS